MKFRTLILSVVMLLLIACQYTVPLSTAQKIDIDTALLGSWEMHANKEDPDASLDSMTILRFSDTEYRLRYFSEGSDMHFRAYLIDPGGEPILQMELLDNPDGSADSEEDAHRYMVAKYTLDADSLSVSLLNTKLISRDINDTDELLAAYLKNKDNPELFTNPGRFEKS